MSPDEYSEMLRAAQAITGAVAIILGALFLLSLAGDAVRAWRNRRWLRRLGGYRGGAGQ